MEIQILRLFLGLSLILSKQMKDTFLLPNMV